MTLPDPIPQIPRAHAGPISDDMLDRAIAHAEACRNGQISDEAGTILLLMAAPIFRECLLRRRAMQVINDLSDASNVIVLEPGARG